MFRFRFCHAPACSRRVYALDQCYGWRKCEISRRERYFAAGQFRGCRPARRACQPRLLRAPLLLSFYVEPGLLQSLAIRMGCRGQPPVSVAAACGFADQRPSQPPLQSKVRSHSRPVSASDFRFLKSIPSKTLCNFSLSGAS